ncbi:MAG: OmpH family outer membrane protein [Spirochaetaceae bacterium]|jgi:outer membrane protein|nr:OmpH family outer membrane protein [Spirochaetaceae bacterium]
MKEYLSLVLCNVKIHRRGSGARRLPRSVPRVCLFLCFVFFSFSLNAQQITRFGVVDMTRVYTSFFKDSKVVRDFEAQTKKVQDEVNKLKKEIVDLENLQEEAQVKGDAEKVKKLEADIVKKTNFLNEYYQLKSAELEEQRKKLSSSSDFYKQILTELGYLAESEGVTMVLNLNDNKGILWYSQSVDLTDKLIQRLKLKVK